MVLINTQGQTSFNKDKPTYESEYVYPWKGEGVGTPLFDLNWYACAAEQGMIKKVKSFFHYLAS